jgi:hypothetical protein
VNQSDPGLRTPSVCGRPQARRDELDDSVEAAIDIGGVESTSRENTDVVGETRGILKCPKDTVKPPIEGRVVDMGTCRPEQVDE